jgi:hypothetical protein
MNRFIAVEAQVYGKHSWWLSRTLRHAVPVLLIVSFALVGLAPAGVINGDFQTGDLTGWNANTLNPPLSSPATVDVITVGGSLVGNVQFSSSAGGHYAGSLSQDFDTGGATKLTFDIGCSASAPVTPGEPDVVDTLDVLIQNLDTNTTIVHPLHLQNQLGDPTGGGLSVQTNGLPIHTVVTLTGSNTHIRVELLMDLHTLDGVSSSGQLLIGNVTLVPEPSTSVLAIGAALALGSMGWLRRGRASRAE